MERFIDIAKEQGRMGVVLTCKDRLIHYYEKFGFVNEGLTAKSTHGGAEARMEIDFLIAKSKISNRHNISPIEVKSGKNYTLSSLKKFIRRYNQQLHTPYVLHTSDLKVEDDIVYLPLYMTSLL